MALNKDILGQALFDDLKVADEIPPANQEIALVKMKLLANTIIEHFKNNAEIKININGVPTKVNIDNVSVIDNITGGLGVQIGSTDSPIDIEGSIDNPSDVTGTIE